MTQFPPLSPDVIEAGAESRLIGRRVQVWNRVTSTNDLAMTTAATRANEGLVILAEEQTAGRGRLGRKWSAPPGTAILLSIVLFPPREIAQPEALVCLSSVAVVDALREWGISPVEIKWPNDLYIDGKKVGGILVERGAGTVIGIGLNVHTIPQIEDHVPPATRLVDHAAQFLDRSQLVHTLLTRLDKRYAEACRDGIGGTVAEWRQRAAFLGECVEIEVRGRPLSGTLLEIDPLTSLTLRTSTGVVDRFPIQDVQSLRRLTRTAKGGQ